MTTLMKFIIIFALVIVTSSCQQKESSFLSEYPQIDLLITNGKVLDGLGNEAMLVDVVIVDDEIVFVGQATFSEEDLKGRVRKIIDAKQRIVAPGFIDLHSHGDPLATPTFENFLAMGVTTITLGMDGDSPPVIKLNEWLDAIDNKGIGPNLAMFVGHGTLRQLSGINRMKVPKPAAMTQMLKLLDDTLKTTFGMSTGLEYSPGLYAQAAELHALAQVVGKNNRLIMSHVRNEDSDRLAASITELIKQGQFAKVHISHIKSVYGKGTAEAEQILKILNDAQQSGIRLSADIYPYTASYAGISLLFPVWAKTNEQFELALKERREELEQFLRDKIIRRNGPQATLLGTPPYTGKTLAELADELSMPYEQVLIKLGPKGAAGAYFIMDDELQSRLLVEPQISISSDGSATGFHPRGHGAFAKIIELYVNQRKTLSLTLAVKKMTSQSAKILGISNRGIIRKGMKADIIIFDPSAVKAIASYLQPHLLAQGFNTIIINGKIARQHNKMSLSLFGKVLKPEGP